MQRAARRRLVSVAFVLLIIPAQMLSTTGSALLLSTLIFVADSTAALNGATDDTMVRPEAIARGTGVYAGNRAWRKASAKLGPVGWSRR